MFGREKSEARVLIEETVLERAHHESLSRARDTWSFSRAERLLGKEYHGRFLIELLQNAADAWRKSNPDDSMCDLVVLLDESPAVVVANRGAPFPASIVLDSLGQIGLSSKEEGEAIGHKGIGFKSTLEISANPEIYSDFSRGLPQLAVRFDAQQARDTVRSYSPGWDEWVTQQREFQSAPLQAVPILRYPIWVDDVPEIVPELSQEGYDTIIRLGHSLSLGDQDEWVAKIRTSMDDVSDQILVLLRIFDSIRIEDRIAGTGQIISMSVDSRITVGGMQVERISVRRNGQTTSDWVRYHRRLDETGGLASEIIVAFRLDANDPNVPVAAHDDQEASSPFHLFFPTRIGSGLPFLVHGYFKVDAARTGFYSGSMAANETIMDALADLVVDAVDHLTETNEGLDLLAFAEIIATSPVPETPLAKHFYARVLDGLDHIEWIPGAPGSPRRVAPVALLPSDVDVTQSLLATFPVAYLRGQSGCEIAHPDLAVDVHQFLEQRRSDSETLWEALGKILRPGKESPWPLDPAADTHFLSLLDLLDDIRRSDPNQTAELIEGLAGDAEACLIPVTRPDAKRALISVPAPNGSKRRARGVAVMARLSDSGALPLTPPRSMDVEFVADGLLDEQARGRSEILGIRPFTVDAVLDRLRIADRRLDSSDRPILLRFLWDLLARERRSDFSTLASSERALSYANYRWFWLVLGRDGSDENQRQRQRRERDLSQVALPAADGTWKPATQLAFGSDWADWVEANLPFADAVRRSEAMRRLDALAPDRGALIAAPEVVLQYLPLSSLTVRSDVDDEGGLGVVESEPNRGALEQFGFLLRLGCWEILPVEGHQTRNPDSDKCWPWPEDRDALARDTDPQAWNFESWNWGGDGHYDITVAEDARFRWPLGRLDHNSRQLMARAVADGVALYESLADASAFCPGCSTPAGNYHSKRYRTTLGEERPSTLALQLKRQAWLPTTVAGRPTGGYPADDAWADVRGLDLHMMRTSPLQHLHLVDASEWDPALRQLCGLETLDEASPSRLFVLHAALRNLLDESPEHFALSRRQSFIGLHRLIYEALSNFENDLDVSDDFEVLCEFGTTLVHRRADLCRHDDGRNVAHRPRFAGRVPFVVLARDKAAVARRLNVPAFEVVVVRQGSDDGVDITHKLRHELTDRIPELLAVMVHHAGGVNPLDPTGDAFRERASRLRNLRVRRLVNLSLVVEVVGMPDVREIVGDHTRDESFLDTGRAGRPVLFHTISSSDWRGRLTRRLAGHLANLSDVAGVYSDTFQLLLTAGEDEREDLLRSWGVLPEHVQQVRSQLGIFTDTDHARTFNWLCAVLDAIGYEAPTSLDELDHQVLTTALCEAGFEQVDSETLAFGIVADRPGDRNGVVIRTLDANGVDLGVLSSALERRHEPRLSIGVAAERLKNWSDRHAQLLVAALISRGVDKVVAKAETTALSVESFLDFVLEPTPHQYLAPVVVALRRHGISVDAAALELDAPQAIAKAFGLDRFDLDQHVRDSYDDKAREARLEDLAQKWAGEIKFLALLATTSGASAAVIRDEAQQIDDAIGSPRSPSDLLHALDGLLAGEHLNGLRGALGALLVDDLPGEPPDRQAILALAERHGFSGSAAKQVLATMQREQSKRVAAYTYQSRALGDNGIHVRIPLVHSHPLTSPRITGGRKFVAPGTVSVEIEWRKKQVGDEAESWAVTAMAKTILDLDYAGRCRAIEAMVSMLDDFGFAGSALDRVRSFARAATEADIEQEALIERVAEFLHVSAFADGFGFDVLGWLIDPAESDGGYPIALEVKSASGSFYFSSGEWACAERMRATETSRAAYAVLAVHRDSGSTVPKGMDLLIDPVQLYEDGKIVREVDTYRMRYSTTS